MATERDKAADAELLTRAREGDKQALATLLDRHQAQVYRFGMSMCRDPEDARDVLQETLLAMARGVRDFRGASSISTWLYTIARSFCIKKRRHSKFAPEQTSLEGAPVSASSLADPAEPPDEALSAKQVERALEQAIFALDPSYREVIILRDVEGLTAPEVAEVRGVTVQAVKSRLHRARLAVRDSLAPLFGEPSDADAAPGSCPDVLTLFSQHLEDEISSDVCLEMERHLERCARCRGACDSLKRTLALCRTAASATAVPMPVQTAVKRALHDFLGPP
jgi:RNA polymerase sigma-70 factor (ECF subfamily)